MFNIGACHFVVILALFLNHFEIKISVFFPLRVKNGANDVLE